MPSISREQVLRVLAAGALAFVVGLCAYLVSCQLCWPGPENKGFGGQWQLISEAPFALKSQFPHRILAPLIAWCIGMGGEHYVWFVRGLHVVMLACVFVYVRWLGGSRPAGALVALAVAATAPVQMYKWHWVGYSDPLSYSLFFASAMCVRRPAVFWPLFLANMLTHELALFMLPWLWFLRRGADHRWRLDVAWVAGVVAAYLAFYFAVKAIAEPEYSYTYFLQKDPLWPWGSIAIWLFAGTHWVFAFGPLLAVVAWHWHTRSYGRERWQLWIVVGAVVAILTFAFDWMRHANLIVLPFVLASARLLQAGHRATYCVLLAATAALVWFNPPWDAGGEPVRTLWNRVLELVVAAEPKDLSRVVTHWLPAVWPTLLWIYALLAGIWLTGYALARAWRRAPSA
jgi:hypothetical protein